MTKRLFACITCLLIATTGFASQSKIVTATGKACMGDDRSRKQTEQLALIDAKRQALEYTLTRVKSETTVKNHQVEKDLIEAYAHASVRILEELNGVWFKDPSAGDCHKITIKAEVMPETEKMQGVANSALNANDPALPLALQIWTDKNSYRSGEKIKIFIRANKHFFARVIYRNAAGEVLQLLPNPYRKNNFMNSGAAHELPSSDDRFDIEVIPPFGTETVTVFGSTSQLGALDLKETSAVYEVKTVAPDIAMKTRGVALIGSAGDSDGSAADFAEASVGVNTVNNK